MSWPGGALPNPRGVCIAFADAWNVHNPTWYRIDDPNGVNVVNGWSIDRGRVDETDRTKVGEATIQIMDLQGVLDPTNSHSPARDLNPNGIDPMLQVAIVLQHPVSGDWTYAFRGFIDEVELSIDEAENVVTGTVHCIDLLGVLASIEVIPDNGSGVTGSGTKYGVPASIPVDSQGDVWYVGQRCDARILAAMADAGWPNTADTAAIFTGNVNVMGATYAVRSQLLQVVEDAADAEFPNVSNVYVDKAGVLTFHGRNAKFDPPATIAANPGINWIWHNWGLADQANYGSVPLSTGADGGISQSTACAIKKVDFNRGMNYVFNACIAMPQYITSGQIPEQLVVNAASITKYGAKSLSFENLLTAGHADNSTTPNQETLLFAQYVVDNYHDPRTRISTITIGNVTTSHPCYHGTWDVITNVEISDKVTVYTSHPGGGGFREEYFVEGVKITASPLKAGNVHLISMDLDVSPAAYYPAGGFPG